MTQIQRNIDDPMKFFFWEIDELILISSTIFIGIMLSMIITFGTIGVVGSYILRKIKKNNSEGIVIHFLYWHGFLKLSHCPRSDAKELIE